MSIGWRYERASHAHPAPSPASSTMASGPRETTAGLGNRCAGSTQSTAVSTAPPNEVASARGARKGPPPPRR
eukprot:1273950-Pyramimonas_sp.AAC.1